MAQSTDACVLAFRVLLDKRLRSLDEQELVSFGKEKARHERK